MSIQYEDRLWNKVNELHERYRRQYNCSKNLSIVFTKLQEAFFNFGKEITNLVNKKYILFEEKKSSQNKALDTLIFNLSIQGKEYNELSKELKEKIIEPIISSLNPVFNKEKEYFNSYNNSLNLYNKYKNYLETSKKKYDLSCKNSEISIQNYIKNKNNNNNKLTKEENTKIEKKISDNLENSKTLENSYIETINETNKMRLDFIEKEKTLLTYYQIIDNNYGATIRSSLSFYIASIRKLYSTILVDIDSLLSQFQNINILEDCENFIEINTNNEKPDEEIKFIPYDTITKYDYTNENAILDLDIILYLKKKINIYQDLNEDFERKKIEFKKLCTEIFEDKFNFSEQQKEKLLNYIKERNFRNIFLIDLSNQRTNGRYKRSKELILTLNEILNNILINTEKEKDYEHTKTCLILSQTFYYQNEDSENKIYLFDFIKKNPWLNSIDFWKGIINSMMKNELKRNNLENFNDNNKNNDEINRKISNICFSQLVPYTSNMVEIGIKKEKILEIIDEFVIKYNIQKKFVDIIKNNIENNKNENNKEEENGIFNDKKIEEKNEEIKEEEKNEEIKEEEKIEEKKEEKKEEIKEEKKEKKKEEIKEEEKIEEIKEEEKIEEKKEEIKEEKKEKEEIKEEEKEIEKIEEKKDEKKEIEK